MSFSYVVMHGAHLAIRRGSLKPGLGYVAAVWGAGAVAWVAGFFVGKRLFAVAAPEVARGRQLDGGKASDGKTSDGAQGKGTGRASPQDGRGAVSSVPLGSPHAPGLSPSSVRLSVSVREVCGVGLLVAGSVSLFGSSTSIIDSMDPDFVKYHLLDLPASHELALNGSLTVLGLLCSSLVPWHRQDLGLARRLAAGAKRLVDWHSDGHSDGHGQQSSRGLPRSVASLGSTGLGSVGMGSAAIPELASLGGGTGGEGGARSREADLCAEATRVEGAVLGAVGCWLANALAFALLAGAYAAAALRPGLLDRYNGASPLKLRGAGRGVMCLCVSAL